MNHIRDMIADAIERIDTYKNPDTSAVEAVLDPILKAAGLQTIDNDRLVGLYINERAGHLSITTEYSVRGCTSNNDMKLPLAVIDAADPLKAANGWRVDRRMRRAASEQTKAQKALDEAEFELKSATEEWLALHPKQEAKACP